ncbi:hypothetical protein AGOR_G00127090 [Albula goreensis]|uniref:Uncharacterized protein n=1 Tax=Albula goreensis TaxID=1534307 RepID=A0A8T3DC66_9TELE|nr:hypothetical protein AGOR_G00127090 [Albula goreensis]
MSGRGMSQTGPKIKVTKEAVQPPMYCENSPMKKKRPPCDKFAASDSLDVFQAAVTDANREVNKLFSKYAEVMSERAAMDSLQIRELEDIVKEVRSLESHLMERKEQLRNSLVVISDKLQG